MARLRQDKFLNFHTHGFRFELIQQHCGDFLGQRLDEPPFLFATELFYAEINRGVAILNVLEEPLNVNLDHHDTD